MQESYQTESSGKLEKIQWDKFVNSLNARTPTKRVLYKFKKINRNYKPKTVPPLERGG